MLALSIKRTIQVWIKQFGIVLSLITSLSLTYGQDISYFKSYGANFSEQGNAVLELSNGNVATALTLTDPFVGGTPRPGLLLTDINGEKIFCKKYANVGLGIATHVLQNNGGFLLMGIANSALWLIQTDAAGDAVWSKTITQDGGFIIMDVKENTAGYLIVGRAYPYSSSYPQIGCLQLDTNGQVLWAKYIDTDDYQLDDLRLIQTDSEIFIAGTGKLNFQWRNAFLMKLDGNADPIWTATFSSNYDIRTAELLRDLNGMLFLTGSYYDINSQHNAFLLQLDDAGNIINEKYFDNGAGTEQVRCATVLENGKLAVSFDHGGSSSRSPAVAFIDPNGLNVIRCKTYEFEPQFTNYVLDMVGTDSSGVIMVGDMHITGKIRDSYLVRTSSDGEAGCYTSDLPLNEITHSFSVGLTQDSAWSPSMVVTPANYVGVESPQVVEFEGCAFLPPQASFFWEQNMLVDCEESCHAFSIVSSTNVLSWDWTFENGNPASYSGQVPPTVCWSENGSYEVALTVTSADGTSVIREMVEVDLNCDPIIPNVFSPNSDGRNDALVIRHLPANFRLSIFNRWGQVVFQSSDRRKAWKGRNESTGSTVSEGVYFYELQDLNTANSWHGHIQLLR